VSARFHLAAGQSPRGFVRHPALGRVSGDERDHVQCVPKWSLALTFAQVRALQPGVCKTVGLPRALPHPALPQMGIGAARSSRRQAESYAGTSMIVNCSGR
jgi:hypothetical protein